MDPKFVTPKFLGTVKQPSLNRLHVHELPKLGISGLGPLEVHLFLGLAIRNTHGPSPLNSELHEVAVHGVASKSD